MITLLLRLITITSLIATGAIVAMAEPVQAVAKDIHHVYKAERSGPYQWARNNIDKIQPSMPVYDEAGFRIGSVQAVMRDGDKLTEIHIMGVRYHPDAINLADNRLFLRATVSQQS
jgi:hypothetical protein